MPSTSGSIVQPASWSRRRTAALGVIAAVAFGLGVSSTQTIAATGSPATGSGKFIPGPAPKAAPRKFSAFRSATPAVRRFAAATPAHIYTVTTPVDGPGTCAGTACTTLRAAVGQANTDGTYDEISLSASTTYAVTAPNGTMTATAAGGLLIVGAGAGSTIIDGSALTASVFTVPNGTQLEIDALTLNADASTTTTQGAGIAATSSSGDSNLTLSAVTISGGATSASGMGGAVYTTGNLTAVNSTFSSNSANLGGAIYGANASNMTLSGDTFTSNTATGINPWGGAINNQGVLAVDHGTFTSNGAITDANTSTTTAEGGALLNDGQARVTNTQFTSNYAETSPTAVMAQGNGYGQGGAIYQENFGLTLTDDTITLSTATGFNGGTAVGGAIVDSGNTGTESPSLTATRVTISSSSAPDGGGGVYMLTPGSESWTAATFSHDTATNSSGGGEVADGTWVGTQVTFDSNTARTTGGGLVAALGTIDLSSSTVSNNTALTGGGIWTESAARLTNDTITGNSVSGTNNSGGGLYISGPNTTLTNVTLASNTATQGGGIEVEQHAVSVRNTIVSGNNPTNCDTTPPSPATAGAITSAGYNIEDHNTCAFAAIGDQPNTDPLLGTLANNGGPTMTMAIAPPSPAIDAASPTTFPATDQRGVSRPQGPRADVGAFEYQAPRTAGTTTTSASASILLGASNTDQATVTGNSTDGPPTGTVNFFACGPLTSAAGCATGGAVVGSTTLTAGAGSTTTSTTTSPSFTPTAVGTWCFRGEYSGDGNYAASSDGSSTECFTVTKAGTTTTTTPASNSIPLGSTNTDGASVGGNAAGGSPTGTVAFAVCGPLPSATGCSSGGASVGGPGTLAPSTANTSSTVSASFQPGAAGTWCFRGTYSGDPNYTASSDSSASECFTVTPSTPSLSTHASAATTAGSPISDTATLSAGTAPSGTITFTLFGPNNTTCTGTPIFTSTKPVFGNGNFQSDQFTANAVGTYRWEATYSGDSNNATATSACGAANESTAVSQAVPNLSTHASASTTVGSAISDTAVLSNGATPTGTITFTLFGPNNATCSGSPVATSVRTVSGNGSYPSDPFTTTAAGTYNFKAVYSGDTNNSTATSPCGAANESVNVGSNTPPPSTSFHPGIVGAPSAAVTPDGTQLVFWRESSGHLFEAWYASGSWHGPLDITGSFFGGAELLNSAPDVTVGPDGTQFVYWQDAAGSLVEGWYTGGTWYGPLNLTGGVFGGAAPLASSPSARVTPDGSTQAVMWRTASSHLEEAWYAGGRWNGPLDLTSASFGGRAPLSSAPSFAVTPDNSQQLVYWQGASGHLFEAWYAGGRWNGPVDQTATQFGAALPLASSPSATVTPDGSTQIVYWRTAAGHLGEAWYAGGRWHGPVDQTTTQLGGVGALTSAPTVAVTPDGAEQVVFWQGTDSRLWEAWFTNHWSGPIDFG